MPSDCPGPDLLSSLQRGATLRWSGENRCSLIPAPASLFNLSLAIFPMLGKSQLAT